MTPDELDRMLDRDYRDGRNAFHCGSVREACPFPAYGVRANHRPTGARLLNQQRRMAWMAGWTDARHGVEE